MRAPVIVEEGHRQAALTYYRVKQASEGLAWLELTPQTGECLFGVCVCLYVCACVCVVMCVCLCVYVCVESVCGHGVSRSHTMASCVPTIPLVLAVCMLIS